MALIEINIGGSTPQSTLRHLRAAIEEITAGLTGALPGTVAQVAITQPASAPRSPAVEVDVAGQLPDQHQADIANSSFEITRTVLRPVAVRWSVNFNAPAHIRALANRSWDEDGQAHRWPED